MDGFRSPVGTYEFMQQFASTHRDVPRTEYNVGKVDSMQSWNMLDPAMTPMPVEGVAGSAGGTVNYSPWAPQTTFGQYMMSERNMFLRDIKDVRRRFTHRRYVQYDGAQLLRTRQTDKFYYVAPGTPEAEMIARMLEANRDPTTGLIPTHLSFEYWRM